MMSGDEFQGVVKLSERVGDCLHIYVDRERRRVEVRELNGAEFISFVCPAVMAGARPEDLLDAESSAATASPERAASSPGA